MERDPVAAGAGGAARTRTRRRVLMVVVPMLAVAAAATFLRTDAGSRVAPAWLRWAVRADGPAWSSSGRRVVPEGTRIKVEVLNASRARGAARSAAFLLRDAGFDVVYFGNSDEKHDSTVVRDRSGHPAWAMMAQRVMAPASVEARPDSGRLVDLSVFIGGLWRPPAEALRP